MKLKAIYNKKGKLTCLECAHSVCALSILARQLSSTPETHVLYKRPLFSWRTPHLEFTFKSKTFSVTETFWDSNELTITPKDMRSSNELEELKSHLESQFVCSFCHVFVCAFLCGFFFVFML